MLVVRRDGDFELCPRVLDRVGRQFGDEQNGHVRHLVSAKGFRNELPRRPCAARLWWQAKTVEDGHTSKVPEAFVNLALAPTRISYVRLGYRPLMTSDPEHSSPRRGDKPVEEIAEDVAESNPDETTRREALEQELESLGRSEEGAEVGDQLD